ncbi:hypothetical protein HG536_0G04070 [Torulaspora globosa]|uniref:PUM-HD domain-containing protein n=1 Tax=Torulaspora globosa TaxID=48254 RepID=A0A7G3ZM09_9SACH|nr:uncharacterized protein HG536_0G04070 [Torulaspora globosa]QLL34545.1 hypothetical protein HG536_0G04070 [Torulaspora globosa]
MSYNHQPQLSVNSIQSLVEPVTPPPLGQMNNKKYHQKTQSLDLSEFNQFISSSSASESPLAMAKNFSPNATAANNASSNLPLINEFEIAFENCNANSTNSNTTTTASSLRNVSITSNEQLLNNNPMLEITSLPLSELDYVKLATDQFGCRFLQKKLESPSESNIVRDLMYDQIKPYFLELILDSFGNYLIQKLCEYLTADQKTTLIQSIYPNVFQISINQYGTRSLQKIIDTVDNENQIDLIIKGFSQEHTTVDQVVTLINDLNGNHVIQKCIFKFPPSKFSFIIDAIVEQNNIITVSTHKHGCCVLQKLLSVCTLQQIFKISVKIVQFLPGLINDQFGNYIIQFLLDIKELDFYLLAEIFNRVSGELCRLSCLKFSSNVVEKYIKKLFRTIVVTVPKSDSEVARDLNDDVVSAAMRILLTIIDIFTLNLNILIRDNYGNYALQTLLDVKNYSLILEYPGNPVIRNSRLAKFSHDFTAKIGNLVVMTKEFLPSIKTTSYAKKIKLKVKSYAELSGIQFGDLSPKKATHNHNSNGNQGGNHFGHFKNNKSGSGAGQKQHARHFSLPANVYHRRSSSSASLPFAVPQQGVQQNQNIMNTLCDHVGVNSVSSISYQSPYVPNGSLTQGFPPQQPFVGTPLPKPNSNPNLQNEHQPIVSMGFVNDSSSSNSSSTNLFQNTGNDLTMMNTFAYSTSSQSSLREPNFSQQRVVSNPFPMQPQPFQQQPNLMGTNYLTPPLYMDGVQGDYVQGSKQHFGFH